jgi:hypothetical protein
MQNNTPSTEIFNEMKQAAIGVWKTFDDQFNYVSLKLERVKSIENVQDNAMVFYRMFDGGNQRLMREALSGKALKYIKDNQ